MTSPVLNKTDFLCTGVILVIAILLFWGALDNEFLTNWDDNLYVTRNPDIKSVDMASIKNLFTNFYVGHYAPVSMLSYMLDYRLWGLDAHGFILHNVVLHGLNGVMLFLILRQFGNSAPAAMAAAVFFLAHPVQVESVAWISQRKNVLSMFFFLQSFFLYLVYTRAESKRRLWYALSNGSFLLALLAKPVAVILPVILFAYDLLVGRGRKNFFGLCIEKLPFALMALGCSVLAIISQDPATAGSGGLASGFHGGSGYATFLTMTTVFRDYLVNICWPVGLSAIYEPEIKLLWDHAVWLSLALLAVASLLPLTVVKERRQVAWFWLAVCWLGLLPVSQIVPLVSLMNDRYLYFPMIGCAGIVALWLQQIPRRNSSAAWVLALALLVILGGLSIRRAEVWANSTSLWQDVTEKLAGSATAWYGLGLSYDNDGNFAGAKTAYSKALELEPDNPDALYNLGLVYIVTGDFNAAQKFLEQAVRTNPGKYDAVVLLAHNCYFRNDFDRARHFYQVADVLRPGTPAPPNFLGLVELRRGEQAASQYHWQQALARGGLPGELMLERARLESLKRDDRQAFYYLRAALQYGVEAPRALWTDPDLEWLRTRDGFAQIVGQLSPASD